MYFNHTAADPDTRSLHMNIVVNVCVQRNKIGFWGLGHFAFGHISWRPRGLHYETF